MFWVLALLCIIIGFFLAAFKVHWLFEPWVWFVAAIAINTLTVVWPPIFHRQPTE